MKKILWLILIAGISLVNVCIMGSERGVIGIYSFPFALIYITIFGYYVSVKKKFDFKEILLLSLLERSGIMKNEWSERKQRTVLSCISIPLLFIFYILSIYFYAVNDFMLSLIVDFFVLLVITLSAMIWINKAPKEESNKNNTTI
ncbi:MAG: hypothetical protein OSJ56_05385 [Prevotella sp.]|uniref:hypothetical protein n=1 Tax=Prevotella sp. PTAC TaxID=2736295 RepID=UPI0015554E20|nr:hypothetical protein [Prevotella sp. PTAC]MCX4293472.1 hypothetical protein [Prevotella sp.]NPD53376.1 hypothetical protein [Prevotella sp. PTAC]